MRTGHFMFCLAPAHQYVHIQKFLIIVELTLSFSCTQFSNTGTYVTDTYVTSS